MNEHPHAETTRLRRQLMWLTLALIVLLNLLAIAGAFLGAERAKLMFNSIPLALYWASFLVLLLAGFAVFGVLRRHPKQFLTHAGCVLILGGGLWGSQAAHEVRRRLLDTDKTPNGYMIIFEGQDEARIFDNGFKTERVHLPFHIRLDDFRIEYYEAAGGPQLWVTDAAGRERQMSARPNSELNIEGIGTIRVTANFRNFRIDSSAGGQGAMDAPGPPENPAVALEIVGADGSKRTTYAFQNYPGHGSGDLNFRYQANLGGMVKDYYSDLTVLDEDGQALLSQTIEVNSPLHYGGYHFYQHSYDQQNEQYTILSVTSDSGLYLVYSGYAALCLGVFWLWLSGLGRALRAVPAEPSAEPIPGDA